MASPTVAWLDVDSRDDSAIELVSYVPRGCELVAVETDQAVDLPTFRHPERAVYVLGAEDHGLSAELLDMCDRRVAIPTAYCLNVATAGSIVLYDRATKAVA